MPRSFLVLLIFFATVAPVAAHDLGAQCKLRGGQIEVTAYFDDDTSAGDAKVTVLDDEKKLVAAGRTDSNGRWTCAPPPPGSYTLVVDAGAGHRVRLRIMVPSPGSGLTDGQNLIVRTKGSAAAKEDVSLHDGPARHEFTRFKLTGLLVGLAIVALVGLILWLVARRRLPPGEPTT